MTADELERIALFVKAVNAAEREYRVSLDLGGFYEDKFMRLTPEINHAAGLSIEPHVGGSCLTLVRAEVKP